MPHAKNESWILQFLEFVYGFLEDMNISSIIETVSRSCTDVDLSSGLTYIF